MRRVMAGVLLAVAGSFGAVAAPASAHPQRPVQYPLRIVVFRDGVNPIFKALLLGVRPQFVYRYALSGFAANLSPLQQFFLSHDRDVLMNVPDDYGAGAPTADPAPVASTPIENFPQQVPRGIRRIGGLVSPTARIDGVDDPLDVDIAVLDSGVDPGQPDLNVVGSTSCNGGPGFDELEGHGTMVAGVAAARDNAFGVVGVAPGARIWSVKELDENGAGGVANDVCAIDWVTAHARTIDVANMSLGGPGSDDGHCGLLNHDPEHWAICHSVAAGVTYVISAGNDAQDSSLAIPASYDEVITVSGMTDTDGLPGALGPLDACEGQADDTFAFFSNYGADIDISAPALCVGSTFPGGELAVASGTSFAAPAVTGAVALIKAHHPFATPAQVKAMILGAREQVHLPGDPDGIDEGVLDISTF